MTVVCRRCKRPLKWAQTVAGYPIALDADPHDRGNLRLKPGRNEIDVAIAVPPSSRAEHEQLYVSHLCPWGKKR